jgi:acetyl-CoA synthetase
MVLDIIRKPRSGWAVVPHLLNYEVARASFSWEAVRGELEGLPGGGLNMAHEAIDRHARGPHSDRIALRWIDKTGQAHDYSYAHMRALTNRFANVLRELGVAKGDRVFTLMGRIPELYIAALGTLKNRSVLSPLFSAFGPEPLRARLSLGRAKVLVTTRALYRKVEPLRGALPDLEQVLVVGEPGDAIEIPGTQDFQRLLDQAKPEFSVEPTDPEDVALLHFTSGTTGKPKGAVHVHAAVIAHHATAKLALDLHPEDIFWCTADPGWVTGTSYGIIAPLTVGATLLVDQEEFDAARWYHLLAAQKVTVWYTAPSALRMLMRLGPEVVGRLEVPHLRFLASVGEPLSAEAVLWGQESFGVPFHDTWWQTETGAIMIANIAAADIKPGSMGRPLPGIEAAIVRRTKDGSVETLEEPEVQGELALRAGWPSMFRGYWDDEERYRKCFAGGWYLTGDLVRRDRDGYFWFVGRTDDAIKSSGHLIGPHEVEGALLEHPAVAEVAAIGKPDPIAGEIVKALVVLKPGYTADDTMRRQLLAHARMRLGAVVAPKEIAFHEHLPRTRSGKILRRLLKARELGLPGGDLSTLEDPVGEP